MNFQNLPLVSWGNGAFMIAIFAVVCVILIVTVMILIFGGSSKNKSN